MTEDGRVKILDFGLAKLRPSRGEAGLHDRRGHRVGSHGRRARSSGRWLTCPRNKSEGKPADHRSDIFSFGSLFYEMLSGRRAFARDSSIETMRAILKEDPAELAGARGDVPSGLQAIVRRCLEKRPEERFQSARDVAFALEAVSGTRAGVQFLSSTLGATTPPRRDGSPHRPRPRCLHRLAEVCPTTPAASHGLHADHVGPDGEVRAGDRRLSHLLQ